MAASKDIATKALRDIAVNYLHITDGEDNLSDLTRRAVDLLVRYDYMHPSTHEEPEDLTPVIELAQHYKMYFYDVYTSKRIQFSSLENGLAFTSTLDLLYSSEEGKLSGICRCRPSLAPNVMDLCAGHAYLVSLALLEAQCIIYDEDIYAQRGVFIVNTDKCIDLGFQVVNLSTDD